MATRIELTSDAAAQFDKLCKFYDLDPNTVASHLVTNHVEIIAEQEQPFAAALTR